MNVHAKWHGLFDLSIDTKEIGDSAESIDTIISPCFFNIFSVDMKPKNYSNMTQEEYLEKFTEDRILLPKSEYWFNQDSRLLIPFTRGNKIGFLNGEREVAVEPKYAMYFGECYTKNDYIMVSNPFILPRSEGVSRDHIYYCYGLIDYTGKEILPVEYRRLIPPIKSKQLFSVQNKQLQYGVITLQGEMIIPFETYEWIDGFKNGYTRIKLISSGKWGLITEKGELVAVCDYIYPFYNNSDSFIIKGKVKEQGVIIMANTFGEEVTGCKKVFQKKKNPSKYYYQHCFLDMEGNEVFSLPVGWIILSGFQDGFAKVKSGVREGVINKNGEITVTHLNKPKSYDDDYYDHYDLINDGLDGEVEALGNIDWY